MRPYDVEASGMGQFLTALRERETLLNNPHRGKPVLYLKCWGSDYPYLQGVESQERWLPVVVKSPSNIQVESSTCFYRQRGEATWSTEGEAVN